MESHRSLTTTAALIHGDGKVELILLLLLLLDTVLLDGASEVKLLLLLLLTLRMELAKLNYYYCSYWTLYAEPPKLTTTPSPT